MKSLVFLSVLSASIGYAAVVVPPPQPALTIGMVTETSSPVTLSPLGWASVPVVVDVRNNIVFVPAGGCEFAASVVCASQPVLAVTILVQPGHTNTVEVTSNLISWTPSNVGWVSDGLPVRYYIPQPAEGRGYRVKELNAPPVARIVVSALSGGLFSFSTGVTPLPGATNVVVISPNGADAEVVLDGSLSRDAENDPLQYLWEEGTNIFATAVKTTRRLGLGRHTITLKVSDGLATHAASAALETIKASAAVDILMALVHLEEETNPFPKNSRPLLATLEAAAASFERGNLASGVNQLQAFRNRVLTQIVPFNQAATNLIQAADEIIRAVTNPGTAASPIPDPAGYMVFQNGTSIEQVMTTSALGAVAPAATIESFSITASIGCSWAARTTDSWIKTSGSGSENGSLSFTVNANTSSAARTGSVTVESQIFVVNQAGMPCNPPTITSQPLNQIKTIGGTATFSVAATGATPLNYQWRKNGANIGGATGSSYSLSNVGTSDAGNYDVVVNNSCGTATSVAATLTVANVPGPLALSMGGGGGETATANGVVADHQGNIIVVGQFTGHINLGDGVNRPCAGSQDMFIAKYNSLGVLVWGKTFGGGFDDIAYGVAVDSAENVVVIGSMGSSINLGGGTVTAVGAPDIFLAKYSSAGAHQWSKCFGSAYSDYGYQAAVDAGDNILISGSFQYGPINFGSGSVNGIGLMNGFVAKFNAQSTNLWSAVFGGNMSSDNRARALVVTPSGGSVVAGFFTGTVNFGGTTSNSAGASDIYLASYSSAGALQRFKTIGSTGSDSVFGVACDPSNSDILLTGAFGGSINFGGGTVSPNGGITALFVARYTASGAYLWSHTYGGEQYQQDIGYGIAVDPTGRVAVTGQIMSAVDFGGGWLFGSGSQDYFAVTYTSAGGYLWAERVNAATVGYAATFTSFGNLITAGYCGPGQVFGGIQVNLGGASRAGFAVRYGP